jgi:mannose-1-phosphate guanylyltransferase/mannose-1-phosphate guanylyltransferase/mannose-6-phosphate isomerase
MNDNLKIYQEERPWGFFRRFTHNTPSTVKIISVKPNEQLSLQSHKKREEFWRVTKGSGVFQLGEDKHDVEIGSEQFVSLGAKHSIKAGPDGMEVLEIAIGEFDEEDITRYEDKYGRI